MSESPKEIYKKFNRLCRMWASAIKCEDYATASLLMVEASTLRRQLELVYLKAGGDV